MKKTAILTLGAFLLISSSATAQENEEVRYNQYGVAVDRKGGGYGHGRRTL